MKDGYAVVHNEKRKKKKKSPIGSAPMLKEMDCHLLQDALLWMSHCLGEEALALAKMMV